MSRYIRLYKWEQCPDSSWICGEEDIPIMDVPAWEHNGWTRDRQPEPVKLYKWEQEENLGWQCHEMISNALEAAGLLMNGWTRDRPAEPPATESEPVTDGRRRRNQEAAIA